jgi:hypothetical protein
MCTTHASGSARTARARRREAVGANEGEHRRRVVAAEAVEARIPHVHAALGRRVALLRLLVVPGADLLDVRVVQRRLLLDPRPAANEHALRTHVQ